MTCEMSAHSSSQTKLSPRAEGFRRLDEARTLVKIAQNILERYLTDNMFDCEND